MVGHNRGTNRDQVTRSQMVKIDFTNNSLKSRVKNKNVAYSTL